MRDVAPADSRSAMPPVVLTVEKHYTEILTLLDPTAAAQRILHTVPGWTGLDLAWIGEPDGADRIVLGHTVNSDTGLIDGLIVPKGAGLGGQVLTALRPLRVDDYCADRDITSHFKAQVGAERIKAMVAVPVAHDDRLLGVLYGASRSNDPVSDRVTETLEHVATRMATAQVVAERARHAADVAVHEERRRLAIELHDTVGAMLYTVSAGIRTLGEQAELDDDTRQMLRDIGQHAAEAAAALRGSLRALNTPPEQVALGVALRELCQAFRQRTRLCARLITLTELPVLEPSRIEALSAAVREALLNVEKHATAHSVIISIFAQDNGVTVTVADDGTGLPSSDRPGSGLGLMSISDRLDRVGGRLTLTENEDGGVTFRAWAPA